VVGEHENGLNARGHGIMAILIQINKLEEFPDAFIYEFGTVNEIIGQVALYESDGWIELLTPLPARRQEFYISRVARVLARHHSAGEYPEHTDYRA
jgi:hypothetical protein